ncbi:unnamed protein product [Trifolium pratense]|uniref:Uncharacterized protein n=1 Tax=Trifolium pratense TaxID=57577 RepID=A0ACB0LZ19_TRIPR|nr:unnamed protein product [Trifolium pratense]
MSLFEYITLSLVAILFVIFYNIWRHNKNVLQNWPIIGMLPSVLLNQSNIHDLLTLRLKRYGGTFDFKGPWFTNIASFIITSDPMNVHHITSKNFSNYGKGSDFREIFEVFGDGIFNLESNEWKQEREMFHSMLKRKGFKIFLQQNIQKKLENCLLPFLDHASKDVLIIDLQDILGRFTFDIAFNSIFGFDSNCLPYNFNELPEISYVKAISEIEDMLFSRHYIPKCIWKLQKWLNIGLEKKGKVAQENLYQFLYKYCTATYYKGADDVDDSDSSLLKEVMKEGLRKGKMVERYTRDTVVNIMFAGNGAVTSGLNWFFWLISTHPIVEAKIIQEIKDNFPTQEENLINNLNVEKLDKLVYLHGAICEALRLYPPLPYEHKCAIKPDILPSGDHVKPNTKLIYSLYAMGRMEQIWGEDCLEFKPERWISDRGQIIHVPSYKFISFNAGPRKCVGKDISLVQIKMIAIAMLWKFQIQVVEGHSVTPRVAVGLSMKLGLKVKVNKRSI